jgi:HAE1 family hydrophobic/amphiphilic exporter-1
MFTGAISSDDRRVDPVAALLNHAVQQQPGIFGGARKQPLISTGGGVGNGIELEISGPDLDALTRVAEMMFFSQVGPKFGFQNVRPDPGNFNIPSEQVIARTDKVRASELGLDNAQLGRFIAMLGDGAIVDDYIYEGDTIDLKVITNNDSPNNAMYIRDVPISTPAGRVVPLAAVSHIERTTAPQEIRRIERQRAVTLQVELPDDVALDDAMRIVDQEMVEPLRASGAIPPTVRIDMAGTAAKLRQVKAALLGEWTGFNAQSIGSLLTSRSFLSLVVIFLLLAALFESWFYPAVIMISVPLATVGGFLGLRIVHTVNPEQQLDVLTMLGFIILIGVVVNNAILIVHQALNFMRGEAEEAGQESRQLEPKRAIAESVRTRVRPIFMSTLTSIGGMLPLVLFPGAGSELYRGLGSVVVGGLLVSSVFTLVLVPLVMSLVFDLRTAVAGRSKVHRPVVAAPAPASAQSTAASADQS